MKVSKRIQYGIEFLLHLGLRSPEYSAVTDIAEKNNLPGKYLEAIAADLRKAGLIEVKRGAGGGYRLISSLREINLLDAFSALDSDWQEPSNQFSYESQSEKSVATFLIDSVSKIHKSAASITLESLLEDFRNNSGLLYYI